MGQSRANIMLCGSLRLYLVWQCQPLHTAEMQFVICTWERVWYSFINLFWFSIKLQYSRNSSITTNPQLYLHHELAMQCALYFCSQNNIEHVSKLDMLDHAWYISVLHDKGRTLLPDYLYYSSSYPEKFGQI